jgi:hypothetical protein
MRIEIKQVIKALIKNDFKIYFGKLIGRIFLFEVNSIKRFDLPVLKSKFFN